MQNYILFSFIQIFDLKCKKKLPEAHFAVLSFDNGMTEYTSN